MRWKRSEICIEGKHFFVEEKKNIEGMGGKYSDKENIFLGRRKMKKEEQENIQKGTYLILRGEQEWRRNGRGVIWRRKINDVDNWQRTDQGGEYRAIYLFKGETLEGRDSK